MVIYFLEQLKLNLSTKLLCPTTIYYNYILNVLVKGNVISSMNKQILKLVFIFLQSIYQLGPMFWDFQLSKDNLKFRLPGFNMIGNTFLDYEVNSRVW